ncbi:hypothetical protein KL905_003589 [Ogataea polymorpha]|uniref:SAC domain-containing protein n=2 Tax=Ogataea polymorpha TaxID=460523 RepID=A0A9P8NVH6_9ASCO|nr:hypothetical protein KL908_003684 [Ogataea polymorpha]KAG7899335.1 hypothetical protein KL935_003645 [Ogataea polymorpha]KAG7904551.1 hypothetical protein KL907_003427 [Ogataea polymorpha]KAG7907672.1 hypothetical protein KL906_003753 [Ogataea polymorpha]KAG7915604.1 hypothetical protein KL927_003880 [Ogataea polymorpha]
MSSERINEGETILDSSVPPQLDVPERQDDISNTSLPPVTTKPRKFTLTKYTIYVTTQRMYIVGSNGRETVFRIMEIDLTSGDKLIIMEDNVYFTTNEIMDVLNGLEESSEGGLSKKITAVGLLGFIRFTKHYYLCVVTKRRPVAILGGYYLYHIDATELIPVASNPKRPDRNSEEARYISTFQNIDLGKTFYYSYNYDLTNTLQVNFLKNKRQSLGLNKQDLAKTFEYHDRFVWNSFLLKPVFKTFDRVYDWFQPIIHGFIDQVNISIFDVQVYVTLIARRSHHFAGARFFKRGVNDRGDVANEVETEQIVSDMLTTSFHDPEGGFYNNPRYTSFVQHRGSIPLSWSQETAPNIRMTKPPIEINVFDPFYSASALHFDNLFKRYGAPVQILNLIKQREKTARETKLLRAFEDCIEYLNQFLPEKKKIDYTAWDMSRASKNRGQDVIEWLENYSAKTLETTGFFHNGKTLAQTKLQQGICRTNCIDCLDRTNTAQFVIGKRALGHQLHALGLIKEKYLEYDSDAINILTEMFHDHGDTIALQYGGSHLVNTLQTYRKINQWTSHSRDMIESVKRFYSNSFVDAQRQEAINLFLGNYVYEKGLPMLWDLNTDYYLHNDYYGVLLNYKPSYTHWYSDCHLEDPDCGKDDGLIVPKIDPYPGCFDNYWNIKYVPRELTSFSQLFEFNMNSTLRFNEEQPKDASSVVSTQSTMNKVKETKNKAKQRIQKLALTEKNSISNFSEYEYEGYVSPFKSRKPHRELHFFNLEDMDNNTQPLESIQPASEDLLEFYRHQFEQLRLSDQQRATRIDKINEAVEDHILPKKDLPVVDLTTNELLGISDSDSLFDTLSVATGSTDFEEACQQYSNRTPVVSAENQQCYENCVNLDLRINDELTFDDVLDTSSKVDF